MKLDSLPYDLLLTCARYLQIKDIDALSATCKSLREFAFSRPVYRQLAADLLNQCRPLPLQGFQKINDLPTRSLIASVRKAAHQLVSWKERGPRPIPRVPYTGSNPYCHFMDLREDDTSPGSWFRVISPPSDEEIDWLSPITSKYTLCATKSGKVVCWDILSDSPLASWEPEDKWELWKCRVEFEERMVYFTMARFVGQHDHDRVMEFIIMGLVFGEEYTAPTFVEISRFRTWGVVINIFLLDPASRTLSAFIFVPESSSIGLFMIPDWDKQEYTFVDTGIRCVDTSNWSCIIDDDNIVIHAEESEQAFQYFYPIPLLKQHIQRITGPDDAPAVSTRLLPAYTISKQFTFPASLDSHAMDSFSSSSSDEDSEPSRNPYPGPRWYVESAHFVRQWWPTVPGIAKMSCTVMLLARHNPVTHQTISVLCQHYFRVPMRGANVQSNSNDDIADTVRRSKPTSLPPLFNAPEFLIDDNLLRPNYVTKPFTIVCVPGSIDDGIERPRPLCAVDFGHAAWVEYQTREQDDGTLEILGKEVKFVSFPPPDFTSDDRTTFESKVYTLEIPEELDLDTVETINLDQSQGSVLLSVKEGRIFILCYN